MRLRQLFLLVALTTAAPAQTAGHAHASTSPSDVVHNVFWQPNELHQGSPLFVTVELERPATRVTGTLADRHLTFFTNSTDRKTWHALAGVDLATNPGDYSIEISAVVAGGHIVHETKPISIAAGDFKTGDITVPDNYVNPTDAEQKQIAQDTLLKTRAYARTLTHPLWSGDFIKPVNAASTPSFGESRLLNEEKTSLHTGTDYPTPEGTAVVASNSGTVTLVRDLFYEGNTIIIDHGMGVSTVYLHMSRVDVHEGDKLAKGEKLGLSGASGRVTGPHLHFGVRWNGVWMDPAQLLTLTLPKNELPTPVHGNTTRRRRTP